MMSSKLVIALLIVAGACSICLGQTANNYCTVKSCPAKTNTLCKYQINTWGSFCLPFGMNRGASVVRAADITTILNAHNNYRRNVAKGLEKRGGATPGSNIRQLAWDDELAKLAQTHAQQCIAGRDMCRNVDRFEVGQNVYHKVSSSPFLTADWNTAIKSWYEEVQFMTASNHIKFGETTAKPVGNYTQVVWAKSYLVGCGFASYRNFEGPPHSELYICNYGESGNYLGQPVYTEGTAGTACPAGTKNTDGLCA